MQKKPPNQLTKTLIIVGFLLYIATPFLFIFGTKPLAEVLPCTPISYKGSVVSCRPPVFKAGTALTVTPIILGTVLILVASFSSRTYQKVKPNKKNNFIQPILSVIGLTAASTTVVSYISLGSTNPDIPIGSFLGIPLAAILLVFNIIAIGNYKKLLRPSKNVLILNTILVTITVLLAIFVIYSITSA